METEKHAFNTQNPQAITFKYEELSFTILGGIRLEGLDRMRVTIKAEFKTYAIRHNLDLYNDSQLEKLIRKCAERFEIGTVYIGKAIGELVNRLENYRLAEIKKNQLPEIKKQLAEEERRAAIEFLTAPDLLQRTNDLIGKSGMIGEETNRLLMYLIFTSRKREYPLHIISLAASGTGKSYLQEKVAELIPEEDKIEITVLSENALYYFGQQELKHKLILIEDLDGAENVLYPLRELKSKRKITKTVTLKDSRGNTKTVSLTVEGPVSVAGCTTQESIYEDNANRSFLIYLDESKEQDEKIMQYQRKLSAGTVHNAEEHRIKKLMKNAQRILQPVTVKNPYAELLQIPCEIFKPRRTNAHYLQFIEAITFYKQYQREQKTDEESGEVFIETTLEDIRDANVLMKEILLRKSDELTGACRNYFERLKNYLQQTKEKTFTSKEISKALRIPISTIKRYHLDLFTYGYIRHYEKSKGEKSYRYEIISYEEYKELQSRITTALDEALENIRQHRLSGSPAAQLLTEPKNKKKISHLDHQLTKLTKESKRSKKLVG
ncbi:MAG TPA: hypothetical protein VII99_16610 [Bacteroidia bacterium]